MARRPPARRPLNPGFKLAVWLTFVLTIVFLVAAILLAVVPTQTPAIERLSEGLSTLTKLGAGAIFGLVTGKRLS